MGSRCQHWLPKKNRFCANTPFSNSLFCGNHNQRPDAEWIPCPIDPSHSVLQANLKGHVEGRCPLLKQAQSMTRQPYYHKGINGGVASGTLTPEMDSQPLDNVSSEMKRNAVYSMSVPELSRLLGLIKSLHASICKDVRDSYKMPQACNVWINGEVDPKLPFKEKHVMQQASILGNLEDFGVLQHSVQDVAKVECCSDRSSGRDDNVIPAVVEFGAGRGYLTQMLTDCYGINRVYLVERRSYKLKADRSLRQKESLRLERLRIDIEDLDLNAVESLQGHPYLATGKHLCGPATDLTLRCCLGRRHQHFSAQKSIPWLRGLAIATCCHHLCQWKQYINREYFSSLKITEEAFHAITWFTSWAVDADYSSELHGVVDYGLHVPTIGTEEHFESGVEEILKNMKAVERASLGFMCKDIIDMGRLKWIKECDLDAEFVKYVPSNISPENHLLIARGTSIDP